MCQIPEISLSLIDMILNFEIERVSLEKKF